MANKYSKVLSNVLEEISISGDKQDIIEEKLNSFLKKLNKRIEKFGVNCKIFIGGSYAKGTLIKKKDYDVDIYLRFNKKYSENDLAKYTKKIMRRFTNLAKVKGSREYYRAKMNSWLYFEIIPVSSIRFAREAKNITDLSYSHVGYVKKKMKKEKVIDGIKLAKAFCQANRTYGAESYVHGFSGYSLELLVHNYGGFVEFLRGLTRKTKDKLVIDIEKDYKNKRQVLLDLNGSRLESPVILIDPTFKRRNALAALSDATFEIFKKSAEDFLRKPSEKFFKVKKEDTKKIVLNLKKGEEFLMVEIKTKKQEGDVAGTKLLKFFKHLEFETSIYFEIVKKNFEYLGERMGRGYFVVRPRAEVLMRGPNENDSRHSETFKQKHKKTFVLKGRLYSKRKVDFTLKQFLKNWSKVKKKKIKEMYISKMKIFS